MNVIIVNGSKISFSKERCQYHVYGMLYDQILCWTPWIQVANATVLWLVYNNLLSQISVVRPKIGLSDAACTQCTRSAFREPKDGTPSVIFPMRLFIVGSKTAEALYGSRPDWVYLHLLVLIFKKSICRHDTFQPVHYALYRRQKVFFQHKQSKAEAEIRAQAAGHGWWLMRSKK